MNINISYSSTKYLLLQYKRSQQVNDHWRSRQNTKYKHFSKICRQTNQTVKLFRDMGLWIICSKLTSELWAYTKIKGYDELDKGCVTENVVVQKLQVWNNGKWQIRCAKVVSPFLEYSCNRVHSCIIKYVIIFHSSLKEKKHSENR